jgi:hypothetical protein
MKYLLLAFHFILIPAILSSQSKDFDLQLQSAIPSEDNMNASSGETFGNSHTTVSNSPLFSQGIFGNNENRFITLLGGYASAEGDAGFHIEAARVFQPRGFGIGAFTSFIRIPKVNYTNWTITGLQLRAGAARGDVKPYGVFDFGMFNLTYTDGDVTLRTATLDLGGGIEKSIGGKSSILFDFRWKRFLDYKGERDAFTIWTFNAGLKF